MHARPSVPRKKERVGGGTPPLSCTDREKIWQVALVQEGGKSRNRRRGGVFGRDGDGNLTGRRNEDKEDDYASSLPNVEMKEILQS